jgi:hypothetical protein
MAGLLLVNALEYWGLVFLLMVFLFAIGAYHDARRK